jgi:hypothetical protein
LDNRIGFQKIETEFPTTLFLFGERKRYQNAGLGNTDSASVTDGFETKSKVKQSIFYHSGIGADTFDKPFGLVLGNRKRQANLR